MAVRMTWASRSQQRVRRAAKHSMAGRLPKVRRRASRLDRHTKDGVPHGMALRDNVIVTTEGHDGPVEVVRRGYNALSGWLLLSAGWPRLDRVAERLARRGRADVVEPR